MFLCILFVVNPVWKPAGRLFWDGGWLFRERRYYQFRVIHCNSRTSRFFGLSHFFLVAILGGFEQRTLTFLTTSGGVVEVVIIVDCLSTHVAL